VKKQGKLVKESLKKAQSSSLSRNKKKNKMLVTESLSNVTKYVKDVTSKPQSVNNLKFGFNRKCDCLSCSKILASQLHLFIISDHKLSKFLKCDQGVIFKWIPRSEIHCDTNIKGPISKWVLKFV